MDKGSLRLDMTEKLAQFLELVEQLPPDRQEAVLDRFIADLEADAVIGQSALSDELKQIAKESWLRNRDGYEYLKGR